MRKEGTKVLHYMSRMTQRLNIHDWHTLNKTMTFTYLFLCCMMKRISIMHYSVPS